METNFPRRNALHRMPVWCRRLLVGTVAFVLFVGGIHWYQRHQINVIYTKWRAEGLPTNREELAKYSRPPVGGTDNSALWLPAIEKATNTIFRVLETRRQNDNSSFQMLSHTPPSPGEPWDRRADVESFLKQLAPEIQALYHAAQAGGQARYPVGYRGDIQTVSGLLWLESRTARYHRDNPRRFQAIQAILALSNTREGAAEGFAWGTDGLDEVIDFLNEEPTDDRMLNEFQKLICQVDYLDVTRTCMAYELVDRVDYVQERSRFPFATANEFDMLRRLESRPAHTRSWAEMLTELTSFSKRMKALNTSRWLNSMRFDERRSGTAFDSLVEFQDLATTMASNHVSQACLNALLAAERHRLRHGSYPATISAIDVDLIGKGRDGSTSLVDPILGKPLSYRLTDSSLSVYCVHESWPYDFDGYFQPVDIRYSVKRK
ncbi:MAG: hypothetical protein U0929_14585 [Planctomycetaceae bacterium]